MVSITGYLFGHLILPALVEIFECLRVLGTHFLTFASQWVFEWQPSCNTVLTFFCLRAYQALCIIILSAWLYFECLLQQGTSLSMTNRLAFVARLCLEQISQSSEGHLIL